MSDSDLARALQEDLQRVLMEKELTFDQLGRLKVMIDAARAYLAAGASPIIVNEKAFAGEQCFMLPLHLVKRMALALESSSIGAELRICTVIYSAAEPDVLLPVSVDLVRRARDMMDAPGFWGGQGKPPLVQDLAAALITAPLTTIPKRAEVK